jgi:hypothetical protein
MRDEVLICEEARMRLTALATVVGVTLATMTVPAEAAWKSYANRSVGFSFEAPGEVKTEKGTYNGALAGRHDAIVYRSVDDNIEYKVTVIDFTSRASEEKALLEEASSMFTNNKKILFDRDERVEGHSDRKISVDIPDNGGRSTAAFVFNNGHLIQLQGTVLPANGDYQTPELGRFIDSLAFDRAEPGAAELALPK